MTTRRIVMYFPPQMIVEPMISGLVRTYDLGFNILRASITPQQEGLMVIVLEGTRDNVTKALEEAAARGVRIEPLEKEVVRDETKCTECGACITICPTRALDIDLESRHVTFDADKCIACELCVPVCPPRAMKIAF